MPQTGPSIDEQLRQHLIGYFPLDGTLADPVTQPTQMATEAGNLQYVPRWGDRKGAYIPDYQTSITFPWLKYDPGPREQPKNFALSFWVRVPSGSAQSYLVYSDPYGFNVFVRPGGGLQVGWVSEAWILPAAGVIPDQWHNISLSYTGIFANLVSDNVHQVTVWVDGRQVSNYALQFDMNPQATFAQASVGHGAPAVGAMVCNYAMFTTALTDEMAQYLACDLFHPEAAYTSNIEYLALSLDAAGAVSVTDSPALDLHSADNGLTISGWVYTDLLDPDPGSAMILFQRAGAYSLGLDDSGHLVGSVAMADGHAVSVASANAIPVSEWAYLTMTVTTASLKLYINGKLVGLAATAQPFPSVPQTVVTIGNNWTVDIYSVEIYNRELAAEDIDALMYAQISSSSLPQDLLAYYDFSISPPATLSPRPELAHPPQLPAGATYELYSRGVALARNAYVNGGAMPDTSLAPGGAMTLAAWINPTYLGGTQVIASRYRNGRGYCLYLQDGKLCCDVHGPDGAAFSLSSSLTLPITRWMQVGAAVIYLPGDGVGIQLFVNGRDVANSMTPCGGDKGAGPVEEPDVPFLMGVRLMPDTTVTGSTPPMVPSDGFVGYIERVALYTNVVNPYYLYYEPCPAELPQSAEWQFDVATPRDVFDAHPALLQNGAAIKTCQVVVEPAAVTHLTAPREIRLARWQEDRIPDAPDLHDQIPDAHRALLATTDPLRNRVVAHVVEGRCYLMAHAPSPDQRPTCLMITDPDDPTALWIELAVDIIALGLTVWGLRVSSSDKLGKVGKSMWENSVIRNSFMELVNADSAGVATKFVGLMKVLWNEGFIGSLLACFNISFFTALRIAGLFAPWVGIAVLVADIARVAVRIYQETQRRKPVQPDPSVRATCLKLPDLSGSVPLTVNGDPTVAMVALTAPPKGPVTVSAVSGIVACLPSSLVFTPDNWSTPQPVTVRVQADDDGAIPDGTKANVVWSGTGVVGAAYLPFVVRVATVVCSPAEVNLKRNDQTGDFEGEFDVSITAEIASDAPVTVTFQFNCPEDPDALEFTPQSLTFTGSGAAANGLLDNSLGNPPQAKKVRVKRKAGSQAPDDIDVTAQAQSAPKRPANGHRYYLRVRKPQTTEEVEVTMVQAGAGNCFIVRNTAIDNGQPGRAHYAVIDGGVRGTGARMTNFLPAAGQTIDYLFCTHYDNDHIAGLIELMGERAGDVEKVVFNPPTANLLAGSNDPAGNDFPGGLPFIIFSVAQAQELEELAGGKLVKAEGFAPPPNGTVDGVALPTLDVKFAGPSAGTYLQLQAHTRDAYWINRASLLFSLQSNVAAEGFKMLVTGDGYNKTPREMDVTGVRALRQPIHFLQVPHHGSRENSDESLYLAFPADHYLISCRNSTYGHPHTETIYNIVSANRQLRRTGYTIWISSELPNDYDFPALVSANEYAVYTMKPAVAGATFRFADGVVTPDLTAFDQVQLPEQMSLARYDVPPGYREMARALRGHGYLVDTTHD